MANCGVYPTTVVTAVTAQNTVGVTDVVALAPAAVLAQIDAVTSDFVVSAVKTGMLGTPELVEAVADRVRRGGLPRLVVDPVLVSTTGAALMTEGGARAYVTALLPLATLATPNLREAGVLLGRDGEPMTDDDHVAWATSLADLVGTNVLVKGGHRADPTCLDVLVTNGDVTLFRSARIDTTNDHGTGCSLSAAIAAHLAQGVTLADAVEAGRTYVQRALTGAREWRLGHGRGPLDHSPTRHGGLA